MKGNIIMKDLIIYANEETLDQKAVNQVYTLLEQEAFKNAKVRIMPDAHPGAGCVIGFTADLGDKVIPNVVGVDIGCGVLVAELGKVNIDYEKLDNTIKQIIPSGFNVNTSLSRLEKVLAETIINKIRILKQLRNQDRLINSIASLGGGNHFIEVDKDEDDNKYLIIHTGSRNLGKQVAEIYQDLAIKKINSVREEDRQEVISKLKSQGKQADIPEALKALTPSIKVPKELSYLEGQDREDYLHDMRLCQEFANFNRVFIALRIKDAMGWKFKDVFESVHNYIGDDNIVRKGAISAYENVKLIIPINMQDGCILGRGKGNVDWNSSAPHGAGRLLSRSQAKSTLTVEDFKEDMSGIYTTTANQSTLDESPRAYKSINDIINYIGESVIIDKIIKPVYNYKASDDE